MKMNLASKVELKYHLLCYFFLILSCDNPAILYHYFIVSTLEFISLRMTVICRPLSLAS